ncbi:MAG: hypothetical protein K2X03_21830 [Bryobacteraceae bacterium]|nr:hypothetical protein [Bryobacteraceae bacterium]
MGRLLVVSLAFLTATAWPQKKQIEPGFASSDEVDVTATMHIDRAEITQLVGAELEKHIYVVEVKVRPKGEKPLRINLDDFVILKTDDGQRSTPFAPSQIASAGGLTLKSERIGGWAHQGNGPVWGGVGSRMPGQLPGNGGSIGSQTGGSDATGVQAQSKTTAEPKDNPLLAALKAKVLLEKETTETVSGLLYFPLEGKLKLKNLSLLYKAPGGKMEIVFQR